MISHHSNLDEDCKYDDVVNEIKRCLEIGISIGEILADSALWEGGLGHFVELTGQQIRDGLSDGCVNESEIMKLYSTISL